jgi:hypothetical protein
VISAGCGTAEMKLFSKFISISAPTGASCPEMALRRGNECGLLVHMRSHHTALVLAVQVKVLLGKDKVG